MALGIVQERQLRQPVLRPGQGAREQPEELAGQPLDRGGLEQVGLYSK
jgi:hypothetical protein